MPSEAGLDSSDDEVMSQGWHQKDRFLLLYPQDLSRTDSGAATPTPPLHPCAVSRPSSFPLINASGIMF